MPPPLKAREIYRELKRRKILVRYFDAPGLDDGLRISIGSDREINALIRELRNIVRKKF